MKITIPEGITGQEALTVTEELSAPHCGSGLVPVLATPAMIALMEKTCLRSVQPHLPEGYGTVGTLVHVTHEHATVMGRRVSCTSKLVEIDRRRLVFEVEAQDEAGIIGRGRHERFIIENTKFLARANGR